MNSLYAGYNRSAVMADAITEYYNRLVPVNTDYKYIYYGIS
jgi:hypothetical protein